MDFSSPPTNPTAKVLCHKLVFLLLGTRGGTVRLNWCVVPILCVCIYPHVQGLLSFVHCKRVHLASNLAWLVVRWPVVTVVFDFDREASLRRP